MNNQLKKGVLEMAILGFLNQEEEYGYAIVQKLEEYIKVKESSIYIILTRLSQNGYLDVRKDKNGSRTVKIYIISSEGVKYLNDLYEQWEEINNLINKSRE